MNNHFYPELFVNDDMTEIDKKQIRNIAKHAISLYDDDRISRDTLKTIVELAMAWEITTSFEEKVKSKEKSLFKYR